MQAAGCGRGVQPRVVRAPAGLASACLGQRCAVQAEQVRSDSDVDAIDEVGERPGGVVLPVVQDQSRAVAERATAPFVAVQRRHGSGHGVVVG